MPVCPKGSISCEDRPRRSRFQTVEIPAMSQLYPEMWEVVMGFHNLLSMRRGYLGHLSQQVATTSGILASRGFPELAQTEQLVGLRAGALLKDIGKLGLPDSIHLASSALSQEQHQLVKGYPMAGYRALKSVPFPWPEVLQVVRHHHEKFDGSGYPDGLQSDDIPLAAQIVSVANFFESLSNAPEGKKCFSSSQALTIVEDQAGKAFSPRLVEVFLTAYEEISAPRARTF